MNFYKTIPTLTLCLLLAACGGSGGSDSKTNAVTPPEEPIKKAKQTASISINGPAINFKKSFDSSYKVELSYLLGETLYHNVSCYNLQDRVSKRNFIEARAYPYVETPLKSTSKDPRLMVNLYADFDFEKTSETIARTVDVFEYSRLFRPIMVSVNDKTILAVRQNKPDKAECASKIERSGGDLSIELICTSLIDQEKEPTTFMAQFNCRIVVPEKQKGE